jgi:hypothetical protein
MMMTQKKMKAILLRAFSDLPARERRDAEYEMNNMLEHMDSVGKAVFINVVQELNRDAMRHWKASRHYIARNFVTWSVMYLAAYAEKNPERASEIKAHIESINDFHDPYGVDGHINRALERIEYVLSGEK